MPAPPSVTVVVPLYNGAAHIASTLESLRLQTTVPHEVIVVDDGSTDGGADAVAGHPLRPTLIRQENRGVAAARNRGAREASGDFVAFLDQDDLWHSTRLETLLAFLSEHPDCKALVTSEQAFAVESERAGLAALSGGVGAWASRIVPDGREVVDLVLHPATVDSTLAWTTCGTQRVLQGPITVTTSMLVQRDLIIDAGGFATWARALDDYVLLASLSRLTSIVRLDHPSVFYRVHLGSVSRSTRLSEPYLSTAVALRRGQVLAGDGKNGPSLVGGSLDDQPLVEHLFHEHASDAHPGVSPWKNALDAAALSVLLAETQADRRRLLRIAYAGLAKEILPARLQAVVRRLR